MEGQRSLDEQQRSPFKWRKNSLVEQRRMRNDRKKRKRHQRRKNEHKLKADVNTDGFSERLQMEAKEKERFLYLARKYYLKWQENKEIIKTLQNKAAKQRSTSSRFGMQTKVHVWLFFACTVCCCFFYITNIPFTDGTCMPKRSNYMTHTHTQQKNLPGLTTPAFIR